MHVREKSHFRDLSPKQRQFVREYIKSFNATKAAMAAGYSKKSARLQGSQLLQNEIIRKAIYIEDNALENRTLISAERIERELARVALSRMTDVADWDETGVKAKKSSSLPLDVSAAVKTLRHRKRYQQDDNNPEIDTVTEEVIIELHNKVAALTELLRRREKIANMQEDKRDAILRVKFVDDA